MVRGGARLKRTSLSQISGSYSQHITLSRLPCPQTQHAHCFSVAVNIPTAQQKRHARLHLPDMFRNLSASNHRDVPPSLHRRRRECPSAASDAMNGGLDLSIHHACGHSSNRFSTLAVPAPTMPRDREYHVSGHHRRVRNSRGTKEAKKRRDARRNRRRLITQILDEQLSRDIDQALADVKANSTPLPAITATPEPPKPSLTFTWPSWGQIPPTPPQLPALDFGQLAFQDLPYLSAPRSAIPFTPRSAQSQVPEWCPFIPSLMQGGGWNGEVPRFTDLSSLPEQKEPPEDKKIQIWRPSRTYQPRKSSRFFPPLTTSVSAPVVRLPPSGCRLHFSDQQTQDPKSSAWTMPCADPPTFAGQRDTCDQKGNTPVASKDNHIAELQCCTSEPPEELTALSSAANLWRILSQDRALGDDQSGRDDQPPHKLLTSWDDSNDCGGVPIFPVNEQPYELPNNEIPHVQPNRLTGIANEPAVYPPSINQQDLIQSAIYLADFFATPRSRTPCCELPPYTPSSPMLHTLAAGACLPTYTHTSSSGTVYRDEMSRSTEHFASEQDLFRPDQAPLPKSRPQSPCDLNTFLSMGHVENCWCRDCIEAPELVEEKEATDDNDDWVNWSTMGDENEVTASSTTSMPLTATATEREDEDARGAGRLARVAPGDDKLYSSNSSRSEEPTLDADDHFLGHYDDGLVFSQDDDFYWV
ncbi:hypothetical protein BST61_g1912 [Cercospora zeina]